MTRGRLVYCLSAFAWVSGPWPAAVVGQAAGPTAPGWVEVAVPGPDGQQPVDLQTIRTQRDWLLANGFSVDRCGLNAAAGTIVVDLERPEQIQQLTGAGFRIVSQSTPGPLEDGLRTQSQYFDPTEIQSMLQQIATEHPSFTRLFSLGTTYEGRTVWGLEITDQPGVDEDEPAIQFNGQHHAREVATCHVVMDVITTLVNGYGVDSEVTQWVNSYKTVCVPMVNPDGVARVFSGDSWWRKNRQPLINCSPCSNSTGVDLNRNYPYLWGPGCGSSGCCTNETYRGPSAVSELETQIMIDLCDQYHFAMATSYHSYGEFIDYPYACSNGSPSGQMPEHQVIDAMMHGVSDGIFAAGGPRYDVYSPVPYGGVNGDDTSWYYAHQGTYAFIIEVGRNSFEPNFNDVAGIVNANRGGWQYLYRRLGQARVDVHVLDGCSGLPLEAQVTLTNYVYDTGELPRYSFLPFGRWTYIVQPMGSYTVRAEAPGYVMQMGTVNVINAPVALTLVLEPAAPPIMGDADCDGDVDVVDFAAFAGCFNGPAGGSLPPPCDTFDFDGDNNIDLNDLQSLLIVFGS